MSSSRHTIAWLRQHRSPDSPASVRVQLLNQALRNRRAELVGSEAREGVGKADGFDAQAETKDELKPLSEQES